jgi:hypothetical protein
VDGSFRVNFTWGDNAIRNTWLQVTTKVGFAIGLARPDVFYFGSLVGETGDASGGAGFKVTASDVGAVRRGLNTQAPVTSRLDLNRDGRVNVRDLATVKANINRGLAALAAPIPAAASAFLPTPPRRAPTSRATLRASEERVANLLA